MSTSRRRRTLVALALAGVAGATTLAVSPGAATADRGSDRGSDHGSGGVDAAVAALRRAVEPYRDVERALADGFLTTTECADSPAGGMGLHYVHPARLQAPIDPARPGILLYERRSDGDLRLVAAEYFAADSDQDLTTTTADRPSLFGQPFDGPMPGHEPGMPVHYDLHVWVGKKNPAGVFAPWNPKVRC